MGLRLDMEEVLHVARDHAVEWTKAYGYHAAVPALLADPAGVPWAWVFLLLLASDAGKNVPLLLVYGVLIVCAADHALYWLGRAGGRSVLPRLSRRFPKFGEGCEKAEEAVRRNAGVTILFGRYLPLVGRWVGVGAGLAGVPYARFAAWDLGGACLTVAGFGVPAYYAGHAVLDAPWFPRAVLCAFLAGTLGTAAVLAWHWWRKKTAPASEPPAEREEERQETAEEALT